MQFIAKTYEKTKIYRIFAAKYDEGFVKTPIQLVKSSLVFVLVNGGSEYRCLH